MADAAYVELRAHTAFSFGDGAVTPEALVACAARLGYPALGVTDLADLGGVVRFAAAARREGVRPVVGVELVVDGHAAAFLARSAEGYRNLAALVTRSRAGSLGGPPPDDADPSDDPSDAPLHASARRARGGRAAGPAAPWRFPARGRPRLTWAEVAERSGGVQLLTGPGDGLLAARLLAGDRAGARELLARWREPFGDRVTVEVQLHHAGRREEVLAGELVALARGEGVPWVVCNAPRYVDRAGRLAHDVLSALRAGVTLEEAGARGALLPNDSWRLRPPGETARRWRGEEAGLDESHRLAELCAFDLAWVKPPMPSFPVPGGQGVDAFVRERAYEGARERWGEPLAESQRRQLDHELGVIARLGFSGFFLVMWDAVRHAHGRGILCQGRGSAANSAVAYCLGITAVDPVRHGLLFERFLSEVRLDGQTEAPDIDVDVEHDRREELLDYVYARYGRSRAAITCIVQQYAAPAAVQDAMRAFGYPVELAHALSTRLHYVEPLAGARRLARGLAAEHGLDVTVPRGKALLRAVAAFDGLPRMRSTHPGGFVLSAASLGDYLPIEPTAMGRTVVQFDKDDLDAVGIPKFDFLGLGSLAAVRRSFDLVERRTGTRPSLYRLPPDDPATFAMISRGDTVGTFQIESRAQIASLVHTRPERLYDIVVQVALIRPGPIQARFVHPYTRRRRGLEEPTFPHPSLRPILERTQGIPIFQEQAMAISMALGGYTAAEADELRRAMGNNRKLPKLLAALARLRERIAGMGVDPAVAEQVAADLESFANYGFPESHAWSFALIAYATSYLKAHYPAEFYAGLLNAWPMGFYSPATLVHDARRHSVEVRPPCLRHGDVECTTEPTARPDRPALRVGWRHVKGVKADVLERLRDAREQEPFASVDDVVRRCRLTRADAGLLARAGAFGAWDDDRRRAGWAAVGAAGDTLPLAPARPGAGAYQPRALDRDETIAADYTTVGLSTTGHPMEKWRPWLQRMGAVDSNGVIGCRGGEMVLVAGMVTARQQPASAKGTIFLLLEDEHGVVNVIVWQRVAAAYEEEVRRASFLAVYGRAERDGPVVSVIGRRFEVLQGAETMIKSRDFR